MAQNRQNLRKLIGNDTRGSVPATVSVGVTKRKASTIWLVLLFLYPSRVENLMPTHSFSFAKFFGHPSSLSRANTVCERHGASAKYSRRGAPKEKHQSFGGLFC